MPNDGDSVGLRDDLLGQMPVNFRSQAFPKEGVEGALGYAERYFPIVLDLVLDFGVMTLDEGPQDDTKAVLLVLGDEGEALGPCVRKRRGILRGCCGRSPYSSGLRVEGCYASTSSRGERHQVLSSCTRMPDPAHRPSPLFTQHSRRGVLTSSHSERSLKHKGGAL